MKQQKFFVGDVVRRIIDIDTTKREKSGELIKVLGVKVIPFTRELLSFADEDGFIWDADYYTIVERAWQENTGVQPVPDGVKVFYQYENMPPEEWPTDADNLGWDGASGIIRWRIADEYVKEQPAEAKPPAQVALEEVDVQKKNKYTREIKPNVFVDVYDVLRAFEVTDPCLSHLVKKALCAGLRGHKNRLTDLQDIKASIERAIEMHNEWEK